MNITIHNLKVDKDLLITFGKTGILVYNINKNISNKVELTTKNKILDVIILRQNILLFQDDNL
jgi:hypothetical protein